jgi:uncharacterized protein
LPDATAATRAASDARLESVDIVRGFALMALFLVHMIESYELYWADPRNGPVSDTVYLLFMGKSFSLLALCFGFSFFILMDRAAQRGVDFTARFAWRLTVLFGIGFVHAVIYRGDIIQLLALMGFLLLAFHRVRSNAVLIAIAALSFVNPIQLFQLWAAMAGAGWANQPPNHFIDPAMPVYLHGNLVEHIRANLWTGQLPKWWFMVESGRFTQILGLYLVGMVLGRIGFFARLGDFARARWIALAIAATMAVSLYLVRDAIKAWFAAQHHGEASERLLSYLLGSWFELSGTAVWLLVLLALFQSPLRAAIRPLAAVGRTTLTLYILQSLIFVPVFYGFGLGLYDDWSQLTRLWVGLAAIAAQLLLAGWWLRRFQYGPIEWVWRALTYWRRDVPFRRVTASA